MPYPLLITGTPTKRILEVVNPDDFSIMYKAEFKEKNFIEKYNTDETFKQWFDYAVDISVFKRIKEGLFKITGGSGQNNINEDEVIEEDLNKLPEGVTQYVDNETGEVTYIDSNGNQVDLGQQINISSIG